MSVLLALALLAPTEQILIPDIGAVIVTVGAERVGEPIQVTATEPPPPANEAPEGLNNCDEMSWYRQRAGLPARFDSLGWRESNCRNEDGVHTGCCVGWWQLSVSLHLRDSRLAGRYHDCGVYSRYDVNSDTPGDKRRQACATKALFDVMGYAPWR
jgi:hypothetical protein